MPEKPKRALPSPNIVISKETTWATEPLRADGSVDYFEVVNRHFSRGVTVENNAVVVLYQALGPRPDGTLQSDRFFQLLGIESLPDDGHYYQPLWGWILEKFNAAADFNTIFEMQPKATRDELLLLVDWLNDKDVPQFEHPWKRDEFPLLDLWLKDNEAPLQLVSSATQLPRYFSPLISQGDEAFMMSVPSSLAAWKLARVLLARAMRDLAEGSQVDAWRDLTTMHRLGRLVGQGFSYMDYCIGCTIESTAIQGELRFVSETQPSKKLLGVYRKQLYRLPQLSTVAEKLDVSERAWLLDTIQHIARGKLSLDKRIRAEEDKALVEHLSEGMTANTIDWNEVLKSANRSCDRLCAIARIPDCHERSSANWQFFQELHTRIAKHRDPMVLSALPENKTAMTQAMSDLLIARLLSVFDPAAAIEVHAIQKMRGLELAVALAECNRSWVKKP